MSDTNRDNVPAKHDGSGKLQTGVHGVPYRWLVDGPFEVNSIHAGVMAEPSQGGQKRRVDYVRKGIAYCTWFEGSRICHSETPVEELRVAA
jgi:hypothetical protein